MGHLEISIEVDHLRPDGLEEPHVLQIKIDGLSAAQAWDRAQGVISSFLVDEMNLQDSVNQKVQAAEGPWCNHLLNTPRGGGFTCNLPPDHRQAHQNFQSGRSWAQRTPPEGTEENRLYHQAMINRIWCNESPVEGEPRGRCCNLWRHLAGPHEYDPRRDNSRQEDCA
jgi:hypothetical protein